ncbi:hypothetical protein C2G38_2166260 [Gigaspora rosea]|uniref:Uncharacterized protein n=1 Tax=Gigaspora rosea TaxID=44941 RepID=A0A397VU39_9GLOM|nr:hypothetical protein C2G38_2166260 [Gigaspora rosea]
MDLYYTCKLLAVAHNKLDGFIALRFRLSGWKVEPKEDIDVVSFNSIVFKHRSSKNKDIWYVVDMRLGICECNEVGAPYKHQNSIAFYYNICGLNQIPTMSVSNKYQYAYLALGEKCKDINFYTDLHQVQHDQEFIHTTVESVPASVSFTNVVNNLVSNGNYNEYNNLGNKNILPESVPFSLLNDSENDAEGYNNKDENDLDLHQLAINELYWLSRDLESLLEKKDPALDKGVCKFVESYKKRCSVQNTHICPAVASFLETCNCNAGQVNSNVY